MATEDWIQESLARLESLEEERNRHEAALETASDPATLRMHSQAIERLDAKIKSLYAELEAAAEQSEGEGDEVEDDGDIDDSVDTTDPPTMDESTRLFRRDDLAAQAAAANAALAAQDGPATVKNVPKSAPLGTVGAAVAAATAKPTAVAAAPVSTPVASPFGGPPAPVAAAPASPFGGAPAPVAAAPAAAPFGGAPASPFGGAQAPAASPFGGAASAPAGSPFGEVQGAPFSSPPETGGFASGQSMSSSFDGGNSFDEDSSGGGSKMGLIIAAVVAVVGIGAFFALRGKSEEPPPVAPAGPEKVIRAGEIPPDTQGPKTVKGSDVDAIKGTQFKEGRPYTGGGGGGGSSSPSSTDKPKKDPRAKIESTDDPLAGIDK